MGNDTWHWLRDRYASLGRVWPDLCCKRNVSRILSMEMDGRSTVSGRGTYDV
jgi:hypothetical protein